MPLCTNARARHSKTKPAIFRVIHLFSLRLHVHIPATMSATKTGTNHCQYRRTMTATYTTLHTPRPRAEDTQTSGRGRAQFTAAGKKHRCSATPDGICLCAGHPASQRTQRLFNENCLCCSHIPVCHNGAHIGCLAAQNLAVRAPGSERFHAARSYGTTVINQWCQLKEFFARFVGYVRRRVDFVAADAIVFHRLATAGMDTAADWKRLDDATCLRLAGCHRRTQRVAVHCVRFGVHVRWCNK